MSAAYFSALGTIFSSCVTMVCLALGVGPSSLTGVHGDTVAEEDGEWSSDFTCIGAGALARQLINDDHDILTSAGFAEYLKVAMMLRPLAWFGVPCSTFVWLAFGHTGRSHRFPEGNNDRIDVSCANRILK